MIGKIHCSSSALELDEEVEGLVEDLLDPGVRTVDLVDDDDGPEAQLQGLLEHEPGLRQGAFRSVDEQQDAVDHPQDAFDLAAEVRVAGRVDDVDLDALPDERHVLGDDGDAALALEIARIEDAIAHLVDVAEQLALPHHGVDERGLPMIDVGDDRDVADVFSTHGAPLFLMFLNTPGDINSLGLKPGACSRLVLSGAFDLQRGYKSGSAPSPVSGGVNEFPRIRLFIEYVEATR